MNTRHTQNMGRRLAPWAAICAIALAGCHPDMWNQPKIQSLEASSFWSDGAASRPIPEGTVEFGKPRTDEHFFTGKIDGEFATEFPEDVLVDAALLDRGQRQYEIFCTPCHGVTGMGDGMIVERGFKLPPSYHEDRLKAMPVGYYFDVISNGFGTMYGYDYRIKTEDRWAIIAYVRALQLTVTPADQLSAEDQQHVEEGFSPVAEPAHEESAHHDEH